jgi:alcohol dehydrogenase (NADP+)
MDCDPAYKNQDLVGKGIADGLNKTGLTREDLWITSKLQSGKKVLQSLTTTLHDLQLSHLDLYHLPYPTATSSNHRTRHGNDNDNILATWTSMAALIPLTLTRHIGLSNFPPIALETLLNTTTHPPATHQLNNLNPSSPQKDFLAWHEERGIHVTASSPLSTIPKNSERYNMASQVLLETSVLAKIARERGCSSPAQVALAWGLGRGTSVVVPSGGVRERIEEFWAALECEVSDEDLGKVDALGLVGEVGLGL